MENKKGAKFISTLLYCRGENPAFSPFPSFGNMTAFLPVQIMDDFLWKILYNERNETAKGNPVVKEPDEK